MSKLVLKFSPEGKALFKQSAIYGAKMFTGLLGIASAYLARSITKTSDIALADQYINKFWRQQLQDSFTSLYVTGQEYIKPGETYVYMSNHESWMDIPAIFGAVSGSLRMVSKAGLMSVPIIGPAMSNAGFIAIDRANRQKAIKQLDLAKERLAAGISIWMAPEGTRSRDGSLLPFKKGGFHLARSLGKAIVPVYIEGAREVIYPDSMIVHPNRSIIVHFCRPIETDNSEKHDTNQLIDLVRAEILLKKKQCLESSLEQKLEAQSHEHAGPT